MKQEIFHHRFVSAITAGMADEDGSDWTSQAGFAVYRNTWRRACTEALLEHYPALLRLAGEDWVRGAAAAFVEVHPPRSASLLAYGAGLAEWIADHAREAGVPYLASVARLDRCWTESHAAADAVALPPDALAALAPEALGALRLRLHPATRWNWCEADPAFTLWSRSRARHDEAEALDWRPEGALFTRPHSSVEAVALPLAGCVLLDRCAQGDTLGDAAVAALQADPHSDLSRVLAALLAASAFTDTLDIHHA